MTLTLLYVYISDLFNTRHEGTKPNNPKFSMVSFDSECLLKSYAPNLGRRRHAFLDLNFKIVLDGLKQITAVTEISFKYDYRLYCTDKKPGSMYHKCFFIN